MVRQIKIKFYDMTNIKSDSFDYSYTTKPSSSWAEKSKSFNPINTGSVSLPEYGERALAEAGLDTGKLQFIFGLQVRGTT